MDSLSPSHPSPAPSRSPRSHAILRPRRSFQRTPFSSKHNILTGGGLLGGNKLQSPVKLDAELQPSSDRVPGKGRGRGGGAMLFPASPEVVDPPRPADAQERASTSTTSTRSTRPAQREVAGLKKLASAFGGAVLGKTRSSTAQRKAFDLNDWNQDLAAIASHPSSSTPTSPGPQDDEGAEPEHFDAAVRRRSSAASSTGDMSSPVNELSPRVVRSRPSYTQAARDFAARLEPPPSESRRRKSDEMEDEERDTFQHLPSPAPSSLRRDGHQPHHVHTRSHSLAHAHSLRSSRQLSYHATGGDATNLANSPASIPRSATTLQFDNPFLSNSPARPSASTSILPPPSKRISVERLGSLAETETDSSGLSGDDAVFGGPSVPTPGPSAPRKVARAKSLSRPSVPSFNIVPIPASSSHPGFETNKLSPALPSPSPCSSASTPDTLRPPSTVARSRASTSGSNLDTLNESGPAIDYFSTSGSDLRDGAASPGVLTTPGLSADSAATMTPPRRRTSEGGGFSLFGAGQPASAADRAARRHSMLPQASGFSLSALSPYRASPGQAGGANASTSGSTSMPDMSTSGSDTGDASTSVEEGDQATMRGPPPLLPLPRLRPFHATSGQRRATLTASTSVSGDPNSLAGRRMSSHDALRAFGTPASTLGRKRNANGALLAGGATSKLGAVSPIVNPPTSSPAQPRWRGSRDPGDEADEEEDLMEEDEVPSRLSIDSWREGAPALTDAATSVSSCSLSTALSGPLDHGDHGPVTASTSTNSLNSTNGAMLPEGAGAEGTFFTPQNYKNVRPLAAAFMSTGLVSKRNRPRSSSTSGAPVFNLHQHLQQQLGEAPAAAQGSPIKPAPGAATAELGATLPNPLVAGLARPSVMPDTPVKKSAFVHASTSTAAPATSLVPAGSATPAINPILVQPQSSPDDAQASPTTTAMDTGSPIGASGHLSSKHAAALSLAPDVDGAEAKEALSPLGHGKKPFSRSISPLSRHSTSTASPTGSISALEGVSAFSHRTGVSSGELSPSVLASRGSTTRSSLPGYGSSSGSMRSSLGRVRPMLFRRRSSGQLSNESGFLGGMQFRSGSSSSGGSATGTIAEVEPMTPTRSVGGRYWEGTQLTGTPTEEVPITPATPAFPHQLPTQPFAASNQSTVFLQPLATPHGAPRASFPLSALEQRQQLGGPGPSVVGGGAGRPQFKVRHSSSTVLSLRQQEMQQPSYFETNFVLLRTLGNGAFSDAWEVADRSRDGQVFAVKRTKAPFLGPKDRLRRLEEVDILRLFSTDENRSPHLISLVDAWEQSGHLFIETELCPAGNLAYWLEVYGSEHEQLDEARVWKILAELTAGVAHLHSRGVLHLDLKPANVFITDKGHLKLGDFGLATRWPRADPLTIVNGAAVQSPGWDGLRGDTIWRTQDGERRIRAKSNGDAPEDLEREGDREYIAPEILGGRYGKEADVFSLGLIILEAAANVVLPDNGPEWQKLRSNDFSDVDLSRLSPILVSILDGMLKQSPDVRASITDVADQPVVQQLLGMLDRTLRPSHAHQTPEVLGAVLAEADSFLHDVFNTAYPELASPAAPAFSMLPTQLAEPPMLCVDEAVGAHEEGLAARVAEDEQMDID
ncbi:hypothetical protein JCM10207_001733 [Rhodosporidiobolus poonsookiae]